VPVARGLTARVVLVVLLTVAAAVAAAPVALGHAMLESTDPADGALLPVAPETVSLTFSEPVEPVPSGTRVLDGAGGTVPTTTSVQDRTVVLALPGDLADGTYLLSWRVISVDAHPVSGASTFVVGASGAGGASSAAAARTAVGAAAPGSGSEEGLAATVVRDGAQGLTYVGAFAVVGLAVLEVFLLAGTGAEAAPAARRLRRLGRRAGAVTCLGIAVGVPATLWWQSGGHLESWPDWLAAATADATAVEGVLAGGAAVLGTVLLLLAPGHAALRRALAVVGAVLLLGSFVAVGHSRSAGPAALVLAADAAHVTAGAVWFGGLVGLGVVLGRRHGVPAPQAARTLGRFSTLAGALLATVGVTGVLLGWRIVGSWSALVTTGYGWALLAKVALAGAVALVAGWNRFRLVPRFRDGEGDEVAERAALRRTVRSEAVLLTILLLVTGVLVSLAPGRGSSSGRAASAQTVPSAPADLSGRAGSGPVTLPLGEGSLRLGLRAGAGGDVLTLVVLDATGAVVEPLSAPSVELTLPDAGVGPLRPEVSRSGAGTYTSSVELPLAGRWHLEVAVRTSRYEAPVAVATVDVP